MAKEKRAKKKNSRKVTKEKIAPMRAAEMPAPQQALENRTTSRSMVTRQYVRSKLVGAVMSLLSSYINKAGERFWLKRMRDDVNKRESQKIRG